MATVTENFINSIGVTESVRRDSSFITLTFLGKTPYTKKDVELFSLLVSEINISKYNQAEFRKIVDEIYWNIFYSLNTGEEDE